MKSLMMSSGPSPQASSSPPLLDGRPLKKEAPEDEIKDFADAAMNELLGWYGYEVRGGVRTRCLLEARGASPAHQPPPCASPSDDTDECSWCKNPIPPETNSLSQSIGDKYCSEQCFSQSRRATFKRAKTCDWCRHVRHTVSYVDFQEGATQLQFCSDKCLNQYKMHIFCRETQAHLDLNPHLVSVNSSSSTSLITPDLWMKNCKSRSASPSSDRSNSPPAETSVAPSSPKSTAVISPPLQSKPVITVAPNSKLMKSKAAEPNAESRREHRIIKANAKKRRSSRCASAAQKPTSTAVKPQDLRITSPQLNHEDSPNSMPQNVVPSPPCPPKVHHPNFPNLPMQFHPPQLFGNGQPGFPDPRLTRPFYPPPNYLLRPPMFPQEQLRPPQPPHQPGFGLPPVTVVIPYPVILPIPLPIPIPIPIADFSRALNRNKPNRMFPQPPPDESISEEPLDFTTNQRKTRDKSPSAEEPEPKLTKDCESKDPDYQPGESSEYAGSLEPIGSPNPEQKLPRFKITRLGAKIAKVAEPKNRNAESNRPLRKRARLVEVHTDEECSAVVNKTRKPVHV